MGGKAGTTTGLALLLAAGMAWAGGVPGGEGNRGLSLNIAMSLNISRFHITLQPPKLENIHSTNMLVASNLNALVADNAQSDSLILADASNKIISSAIVRAIEKQFTDKCDVAENQSYVEGREAWGGGLGPALSILTTLKYKYGIATTGFVQTTVAQPPSHGQVAMIGLATKSFPGATFEVFQYTPNKDYLGEDKVAFEVTAHGKKFRVSYVIHVQQQLDDEVCRPPGEDRGELQVIIGDRPQFL